MKTPCLPPPTSANFPSNIDDYDFDANDALDVVAYTVVTLRKSGLFRGAGAQINDAPHRALVVLQCLNDQRTKADTYAVLVSRLMSMEEVKKWHVGIKGNTLEERYAFIYDVLIAKADLNLGE
jgi:hypothetical protein